MYLLHVPVAMELLHLAFDVSNRKAENLMWISLFQAETV
jgi:hypothetical protein